MAAEPEALSTDLLLVRASVEHRRGDLVATASTLDRLLGAGPVGWVRGQAVTGRLMVACQLHDRAAIEGAARTWIALRESGTTSTDAHLDNAHLDEEPVASTVPAELLTAMRAAQPRSPVVVKTSLGKMTQVSERMWEGRFRRMRITFTLPPDGPDDPSDPAHGQHLRWVRGFVVGVREREAEWVSRAVDENAEFLDDRSDYAIVAGNFSLHECTASNGRGPDLTIAIDDHGLFAGSFIAH